MTPAELVRSLHRRGVVLMPSSDGQLRYRPLTALSPADRAILASQRAVILAYLESDPVGWRTAVMASQIRPRRRPPAPDRPAGHPVSTGYLLLVR
jgi:hypothetical protein